MATANVYIDGFNLYYGSLKRNFPQYKRLDLQSFAESLLPGHHVNRVRYFTARLRNAAHKPGTADRQRIYLRALATLPKVSIHYGHFSTRDVYMPLTEPPPDGPPTVQVRRTEEKGTDVNLASYLLWDCFFGDCDEAAVISNDSDFAEPIRLIRDELKKPIGVINPHSRQRSARLHRVASWSYASINRRHFQDHQLPQQLSDSHGTFYKPPEWCA